MFAQRNNIMDDKKFMYDIKINEICDNNLKTLLLSNQHKKISLKLDCQQYKILFEHLENNNNLTDLNLGNIICEQSDRIVNKKVGSTINYLKNNKNIKTLGLTHHYFASKNKSVNCSFYDFCQFIGSNNSITSVDLSNNDLGFEEIWQLFTCLQNNVVLTNLNLSFNRLGYDNTETKELFSMLENTALTCINLSDNCLQDIQRIFLGISNNTKLKTLKLRDNSFDNQTDVLLKSQLGKDPTNDQIRQFFFEKLPTVNIFEKLNFNAITKLDLSDNEFSEKYINDFFLTLKNNTQVTSLNLSNNSLANSITQLLQFLNNNDTLIKLKLHNCDLKNVKDLGLTLETTNISSLVLSGNKLGKSSLREILYLIENNKKIKSLNLGKNSIGPVEMKELVAALQINTTITKLNLRKNYMGNYGLKELTLLKTSISALTNIDLSSNDIRYKKGAKYIIRLIENNKAIKKINLDCNELGDCGIYKLSKYYYKKSPTIKFNLRNNDLDFQTCQNILKLFGNNINDVNIKYGKINTDYEQSKFLCSRYSYMLVGFDFSKRYNFTVKKVMEDNTDNRIY